MTRQCLVAAILHQPEVKCEDLEKIVVGDDSEKFF